jgi:hypothetical protein
MAGADHMRAWSKSLQAMVRSEADYLIGKHGEKAVEVARRAARIWRDKRNHSLARKYALVAAYIEEKSKSA